MTISARRSSAHGYDLDAAVIDEAFEALATFQAIADGLGERAFLRQFFEPLFQPREEFSDERFSFGLACGAAFVGGAAADVFFDGVKRSDALERFFGDRRRAAFGVVEEVAPPMRPSEGELERDVPALVISKRVIAAIAVDLQHAFEALERGHGMCSAAPRRIDINHARRLRPIPRSIIARNRP